MAAFETYLSRQAMLAGAPADAAAAAAEGSGERDVSPLRSRLPEAPAAAFGAAAGSLSPVPGAPMPGVLLRPMDPAQQQQQAHVAAAVAAAAAGGWQRPLVSEVVWLEGCLLVALLDLRLNGGRSSGAGSSSVGGSGSSGGGANREGGREASSSSRPNSSTTSGASTSAQQQQAVRGLVAQLVRTMASERRQLMQRVRQLQASGGGGSGLLPPSHPSPVSFLSYAGAGRRTQALTSPLMVAAPGRGSGGVGVRTASLTATLAAIPGAGPSPSALRSELSRYSTGPYGSTASAAAAGLLDVEMSTTSQRRGGGGRGGGGGGNGRTGGGGGGALLSTSSTSPVRSSVRRSTDTDAVLPAPLANLYKSESGGMALPAATSMPAVPLQATNSECLLPPLPGNHYHPTQHAGHSPGHSPGPAQGPCSHAAGGGPGAPLQAPDMDELMDVLQALDASQFRRSRTWNGPSGRQSAWAGLEAPAPGAPGQPAGGEGGEETDPRDGGSAARARQNPFATPPRPPHGSSRPPLGPLAGGAAAAAVAAAGGSDAGEVVDSGPMGRTPGRTVSWSSPGVSPMGGIAAGAAAAAGGGGSGGSGVGSGSLAGRGRGPGGRLHSAEGSAHATPTKVSPYLLPPGAPRGAGGAGR
ncbi:hypothetical protein Agub_g126 [Astrephomene gubernaculifera]|uniref:Uncharacterized protein n=1 Tax=Astrephomene gubernaculifera TaxID=47775 RepID=A0AAD3DD81_9CHLO|nr:hypothetical protein Agub_g126 [Astrephomene gubernaculifera]